MASGEEGGATFTQPQQDSPLFRGKGGTLFQSGSRTTGTGP